MRRAHRWLIAVGITLLGGCASSADAGTSTTEDVLWSIFYVAVLVAGIIGAKLLVESHQKD